MEYPKVLLPQPDSPHHGQDLARAHGESDVVDGLDMSDGLAENPAGDREEGLEAFYFKKRDVEKRRIR